MSDMSYRPLGDSGLMVSAVGIGCNAFGRRVDLEGVSDILDGAQDAGVTLLDTADVYGGNGASESLLGRYETPEEAVHGEHVDLMAADSEPPSNLSATGQADVLVRINSAGDAGTSRRFWIWMAADNLKLAALNAIACANELRRLRPHGKVQ